MSTLLLRLAAPLQAWGTESKYNTRTTNREPSKSGVIGLLAAALGCKRDDDAALAELGKLRFGVRVDREGEFMVDYQTVFGNIMKKTDKPQGIITYRHYLADAVFLAGLESDDIAYLRELSEALDDPVFPLFLGRRSCPPTLPLNLGIRDCGLEKALRDEPWQISEKAKNQWARWHEGSNPHLRIVYEPGPGEKPLAFLKDMPLTFNPLHRQYGYRGYTVIDDLEMPLPEHDPMSEL